MSHFIPENNITYVISNLKRENKHTIRLYLQKIVGYEMKGKRILAITTPLKGTKFNEVEAEEYPAIRSKTERGDRMLDQMIIEKSKIIGRTYDQFFKEYKFY